MSTWSDAPKIQGPPQTGDVAVLLDYVKKLANITAKMAKDLEFILNGNVAFDNIRTNGIEAKNIKAQAITADKIQAGAVTADKISVNELSAISANLGHITAGLVEAVQIFGSYISTNRYGYPKVEISDTSNMVGAWKNNNNAIQIYSPSDAFSPVIKFITPVGVAYITYNINDNSLSITSNDANINISTQKQIQLFAGAGVYLTGWDKLINNATGRNLKQDFQYIGP